MRPDKSSKVLDGLKDRLVDPEKVTFRQVEAEYRGLAGLSG
jgi:hypothetical protein